MTQLEIRPATFPDADQVASWPTSMTDLQHWASRETKLPLPPGIVRQWWTIEGTDAVCGWIAGELVAYGELWLDHDAGDVELAHVIIHPGYRNQGIGAQFITLIAERAKAHGLPVSLRVVPGNAAAVRCYAKAGFIRARPEAEFEWNKGQPVEYEWYLFEDTVSLLS